MRRSGSKSREAFPQVEGACTARRVLAGRGLDAYACDMARADCRTCGGSGWKVVERRSDGAQPLAEGGVGRPEAAAPEPKMVWAVPCDCTATDRTERTLERARIPERYRHCDFDNFETDNEHENASRDQLQNWNRSLTQAKLIVERFAEEYMPTANGGMELGLLLMGPCGVGKTHLAVAALKQIVLRGTSGLFYDYRELLKEIQGSYNPESQSTEMSVLEPVLSAELLVLDDVGSSKPSTWALETVGHILNSRYNAKRVTLLTTNFLDSEATHSADSSPLTRAPGMRAPITEDSLTERIGKRIRSRLYEMCRTIEIVAPDYRKEIRNVSRSAD
jgi:DNA replication protein DnaC